MTCSESNRSDTHLLGKRKTRNDDEDVSQPRPSSPTLKNLDPKPRDTSQQTTGGIPDIDASEFDSDFDSLSDTDSDESSSGHDPYSTWTVDSAADFWARRKKPPASAVFIHAGAGYHSQANEHVHLQACDRAARAGMRLLKSGGSAVDAVEAAIKILENIEITNAGFGSNLAIDGTVKCDATVVDYLGRSGACGAVPNVKNPISLARSILDNSNVPLSLRRVPPNLLIGLGAKDFAHDNNIELVHNDRLVSRNAKDRYIRWQEDLKRAEESEKPRSLIPLTEAGTESEIDKKDKGFRVPIPPRDHANAILSGTWNEGQPDSPGARSPLRTPNTLYTTPPDSNTPRAANLSPRTHADRNPLSLLGTGRGDMASSLCNTEQPIDGNSHNSETGCHDAAHITGLKEPQDSSAPLQRPPDSSGVNWDPTCPPRIHIDDQPTNHESLGLSYEPHEDRITDTVGAIAIDRKGRMAAGSSSGGIGMKHRGRIGPAALVGIGTAVIPADEEDPDDISVAAVTSGTGEHMATTMASQKCAERLYHMTRRGQRGKDTHDSNETKVLESFVINDFQNHPGVRTSTSAGAIGVMVVKKVPRGAFLYFAHNTDSFALASMGSNDRDPTCVMSRLGPDSGGLGISQGARKILHA